jgi:hypothetical protein
MVAFKGFAWTTYPWVSGAILWPILNLYAEAGFAGSLDRYANYKRAWVVQG